MYGFFALTLLNGAFFDHECVFWRFWFIGVVCLDHCYVVAYVSLCSCAVLLCANCSMTCSTGLLVW